ncbi:MAG: hypothetical protein JRC86_12825 [Deltaproteobacteria bacterium]|nr:hypothetical protein [Deltaproteobacteria bacterium]
MKKKAQRLENRRKVNARAVAATDKWIQDNFESQGSLAMGGKGWRSISAQTLLGRREGSGSGSHKILQDTGDLKKRWKHTWDHRLGKIQSGVDYAEPHHYGNAWLPVRRILPMDRQIWPILEKLYAKFLKERRPSWKRTRPVTVSSEIRRAM